MARPREFDRDEVLAKAVRVFANHGFEGTSTEVILKGMGISRQSMYDTFGDKRQLYLEALRRYCSESTAEMIGLMHSQTSAIDGIELVLFSLAARPAHDACLGVSATAEFGRSDSEISAINDAAGATLSSAFEQILAKGKSDGEVSAELEPRIGAQFLGATLAGMKVAARGGATTEILKNIARTAMRSLA